MTAFLRFTPNGAEMVFRPPKGYRCPDLGPVRNTPTARREVVVRGRFVQASGRYSQRVIVRVKYKAACGNRESFVQSLKGHAGYITRKGGLEAVDENGKILTRDEVNEKLSSWHDDERYYNVVLSPENGRRIDLDEFTRRTMDKAERDILSPDEQRAGVRLEYVQVQHWDTEHPHVHVMVRGDIDGKELRLSPGYASHGLRSRAEETATAMLGFRIARDMDIANADRVLKERRQERGLDPDTGKQPGKPDDEEKAAAGAKVKDRPVELDEGIG